MSQPPRADVGGEIYPVLNRDKGRATIFHKDADYENFGWVEPSPPGQPGINPTKPWPPTQSYPSRQISS
jgi:hypothetical protein